MGDRWNPGLTALAAVVGSAAALLAVKGGHQGLAFVVALVALGVVGLWFVGGIWASIRRWWMWLEVTWEGPGDLGFLVVRNRGGTAEFQSEIVEVRRDDLESFSPQTWTVPWSSGAFAEEIVRGASAKISIGKMDYPQPLMGQSGQEPRLVFSRGPGLIFGPRSEVAADFYGRFCLVRCRIIRKGRSNRHRDYRVRLAVDTSLHLDGSVSKITRRQWAKARMRRRQHSTL